MKLLFTNSSVNPAIPICSGALPSAPNIKLCRHDGQLSQARCKAPIDHIFAADNLHPADA